MGLVTDHQRDPHAATDRCAECGEAVIISAAGVSMHATGDPARDYDLDEQHVPYLDETAERVTGGDTALDTARR